MASRSSKPSIVIASIIALAVASSAYSSFIEMRAKKDAQVQAYDSFVTWKNEFNALKPKNDIWIKTMPAYSEVTDLSSLISVINISGIDPDSIKLSSISEFKAINGEVRAYKACVSSDGSSGVVISGASTVALLNTAKSILSRPDIIASDIEIKNDTKESKLILNNMCVLLRAD